MFCELGDFYMVEYELNSDFYNLSSSLELFINQNHRYITNLFVITSSITSEFEEKFQNEVADIMVCCLIISGYMNFDIESALNRVMEKNRLRAEKQGDKL